MAAAAAAAFTTLLLCLCSAFPPCLSSKILKRCGFDAIYQLGDSLSDTGNLIQQHPQSLFAHLPYGHSFLINGSPTGRCSDGLLIIDYLAISAGIPLLEPYLNPNSNMSRGRGANFAVAGSTALPPNVLLEKGISPLLTNTSLSDQLDWMSTHFNTICYNGQDCVEKLKSALFVVGEMGASDYIYGLHHGQKIEDTMEMVPLVVESVKNAITRVIGYGARRIVVPGNFPFGCFPIYLAKFKPNNTTSAYDQFSCLKKLNSLSILHNVHLKQAIQLLKKDNPNVTILYGDYYKAYTWVLNHSASLGFEGRSLQKACCGTGGDYGLSMCGGGGARVAVCPDPNKHISWDGVHLTQMAYRSIASKFIADVFQLLQCH